MNTKNARLLRIFQDIVIVTQCTIQKRVLSSHPPFAIVQFIRTIARKALAYQYAVLDIELINDGNWIEWRDDSRYMSMLRWIISRQARSGLWILKSVVVFVRSDDINGRIPVNYRNDVYYRKLIGLAFACMCSTSLGHNTEAIFAQMSRRHAWMLLN